MAYASQSGRARTNASNPRAFAVCDRCGIWYNFQDLKFQFEWRGPSLENIRILVCNPCYDTPQQQLRSITIPADPTPIAQARVQDFNDASTDYRTLLAPTVLDPTTQIPIPDTTRRATENGDLRTTQPIGRPLGLAQGAIMPLEGKAAYDALLPVSAVASSGSTVVVVTCSSPHNLENNAQVSVLGLTNPNACGFYNVTVISETVFSYMTNSPIFPASLLMPGARIVTANIGIPRVYAQIPHTGG